MFIGISLIGCSAAEFLLSDISGWDFSACVDGFSTCRELLEDNQDKIFGGQETIDEVLP
ncbi:hypothetical protein LCGC14_1192460 [marine sediment metagenome]|uniref:Uncharacterized protein n=1 Tax=marine sediment metagenome TaxID=412755 RepID=A0A0F9P1M5_9ZZZZ